jgi:hypothetical protein
MEPEVETPGEAVESEEDSKRSRRRRRRRRSRSKDDEEQARQTDAVAALLKKAGQTGSSARPDRPARDAPRSEPARAAAADARPPAEDGRKAPPPARDKSLPGKLISGSRDKPDKPAAEKLPKRLTNKQIARKLSKARRRAQACLRQFGYYKQTLRVRLTIRGATGRIVSAKALGRYKGTAVGRCGERAVKGAQFSRFSDANQVYTMVAIVIR